MKKNWTTLFHYDDDGISLSRNVTFEEPDNTHSNTQEIQTVQNCHEEKVDTSPQKIFFEEMPLYKSRIIENCLLWTIGTFLIFNYIEYPISYFILWTIGIILFITVIILTRYNTCYRLSNTSLEVIKWDTITTIPLECITHVSELNGTIYITYEDQQWKSQISLRNLAHPSERKDFINQLAMSSRYLRPSLTNFPIG